MFGRRNVQSAGVKGVGFDDTEAWQAIASEGGSWIVPPGMTCRIGQVTVDAKLDLYISPGAVFEMRSVRNEDTAIFLVQGAGAAGTKIWGGGTLRGRSSALLPDYLALNRQTNYGGTAYPSYTIEAEMDGIRVEGPDDVIVTNLVFEDFLGHGFIHRSGDGFHYSNLRFRNCVKMANIQFGNDGYYGDFVGQDIGNQVDGTTVPLWQPAFETRDNKRCVIGSVSIENFRPRVRDEDGDLVGDPIPIAFVEERLIDCKHTGAFSCDQYEYSPTDDRTTSVSMGMMSQGAISTEMPHIQVKGFYYGLETDGGSDCIWPSLYLDGQYNITATNAPRPSETPAGLLISGNGLYSFATPLPDNDYRGNAVARDVIFKGGIIKRCGDGVNVSGAGIAFHGIKSTANAYHGWKIAASHANTSSFPNAPVQKTESIALIGCDGNYNGQCGVALLTGNGIGIVGGDFENNGQGQTSGTAYLAVGVTNFGPCDDVRIVGSNLQDTQAWPNKVKAASYVPGAVVNRRTTVLFSDPSNISLGQFVTLVGGTGSDVKGKIVDLQADVAAIEFGSDITLTETGKLTAISGTASSSGLFVTGAGSDFATKIVGPVFVKAVVGGTAQYRRVAKVYSNTSLQTTEAFSPAIPAGTAISMVQCDVAPVPSQYLPVSFSTTASRVEWNAVQMAGCIYGAPYLENSLSHVGRESVSVMEFDAVGDWNPDTEEGADDTDAINRALSYWAGQSNCKLVFPQGRHFYYNGSIAISGLRGDGKWQKGNSIVMDGCVWVGNPGATTGNPIAWRIGNFENLKLDLKLYGGGKAGDFSVRSPNDGGTTAIQLHEILWADIICEQMDYQGRGLHTTTLVSGNAKHCRNLNIELVTGNRPDTPPTDSRRKSNGQPLFADNTLSTVQYGSWGHLKRWRGEGSLYGVTFEDMTDLSAGYLEWGKVSRGPGLDLRGVNLMRVDYCYPTEMSYEYPPASGNIGRAVRLCSSATRDTYRVTFVTLHCDISHQAVYATSDNHQGNTHHQGFTILKLESNVMDYPIIHLDDYPHPVSISHATVGFAPTLLKLDGACGSVHLHVEKTRSMTQDIVDINGTSPGIYISGEFGDTAAGYSIIDCGPEATNYIELNHVNIPDASVCAQAINIPAGAANKVRMTGGRVLGTAPKFNSGVRPELVRDVLGIRSSYRNQATIPSGQTSVTLGHTISAALVDTTISGGSLTPPMIHLLPRHPEVLGAYVSGINATQFTITVPAAVTADRIVDWSADAVFGRGDTSA